MAELPVNPLPQPNFVAGGFGDEDERGVRPAATAPVDAYEEEEDEDYVITGDFESAGGAGVTVAQRRESARSRIAFLYVASFLLIIAIVFAYAALTGLELNGTKDLLVTVSGILSGPLGFIIGFYFKSEEDNR